jgi:hypothetical protein
VTDIAEGFCQCGCGQRTNIAKWNDKRRGAVKGMPTRYLPRHPSASGIPENNSRWKGGKRKDKDGYVLILRHGHPCADSKGYIREHVLLAEKVLQRHLRDGECTHHHNQDKANNGPGNIVICQDQAYHMLLHQRMRAMDVCGNANYRKCKICKNYDAIENMSERTNPIAYIHKSCWNEYAKGRRDLKGKEIKCNYRV